MRIEQLYYFLEAAKAGSFTKAAQNLYLQQPSLREGIINLENELGQPLLERTQRGVKLSAYGEYCLPHIRQMVDIYEMLKGKTAAASDEKKILRIEACSVYNMTPGLLAAGDELYCQSGKERDCRIQMNDDKIAVINGVIKRRIDIGLIVYFQEELERNKLLMAQMEREYRLIDLAKYELRVYMRRDHPLAKKKKLMLADVADYLLIFILISNPPILDLLEAEVGRQKISYTTVSNLKLVSKYCLQENSLFFSIDSGAQVFDEGIIYRTFDKKYIEHNAAVIHADAVSEDILKYIEILKTLLQNQQA